MLVVNIGTQSNKKLINQTVNIINRLVGRTHYATLMNLGIPSMKNDFGFELTDRLLTQLYDQYLQSTSTCEYVILTNGDNFYSRRLGEKILPHIKAKKDIIAWGFVSHYYWRDLRESTNNENKKQPIPQILDDGTYKCITAVLRVGGADLGAVAYRLGFLWKHKLHFRRRPGEAYEIISDGKFLEAAARLTNSTVLLRQTLYMHQ
jgi:hypothetical protein